MEANLEPNRITRAIIDAIHSGELVDTPTVVEPIFGLNIPMEIAGIPDETLVPEKSWPNKIAYEQQARKLARMFQENFAKYADVADEKIAAAGPKG